jgi:hypothetical protein
MVGRHLVDVVKAEGQDVVAMPRSFEREGEARWPDPRQPAVVTRPAPTPSREV